MLEGFFGYRGEKKGRCLKCGSKGMLKNGHCKRCRVMFRYGTNEHALQNTQRKPKKRSKQE